MALQGLLPGGAQRGRVWQAAAWWEADLSAANSATVWVAMCQREVPLCCVGAVFVCLSVMCRTAILLSFYMYTSPGGVSDSYRTRCNGARDRASTFRPRLKDDVSSFDKR